MRQCRGSPSVTGRIISHYRILDHLGDGQTGVVYKAHDLHLNRPIALKVLREDLVANGGPGFLDQAKAASALNHPNLVAIYDIDSTEGFQFVAMEFVKGRNLSAVINRKAVPPNDAIKYGIQLADALACAHSAGIVHGELTPNEVLVTEAGAVKVLNTGFAPVSHSAQVPRFDPTVTSETHSILTKEAPQPDAICYKAPEQVEGRGLDRRSDVFTFGAILYEMLTGRPAFCANGRKTASEMVLTEEPRPISELVQGVPAELERVVRRCLRKDPSRRFQMADDLKLTLEELKEHSSVILPAVAAPRPTTVVVKGPSKLALGLGGLGIAAVSFLAAWFLRPPAKPLYFKLSQITRDSGVTETPALSPDGKLVAYSSDRVNGDNLDLWVQHIDGGGAVRLTSHPAADHSPSFSPDSTTIAFYSERDGGGIYVVPSLGGEARLIAAGGRLPRFSPDGSQIAYFVSPQGGLVGGKMFVVTANGASTRQLQAEFTAAAVPLWTPDGKSLLFVGTHPKDGGDVWVTPLDKGPAIPTGAGPILQRQGVEIKTLDALSPDGMYIYFTGSAGDSTNLWRMPISPRAWKVTGEAERLTSGTADMHAAVSSNGRIAFTAGARTSRLWTTAINSDATVEGELMPLTSGGAQDTSCDISEDGNLVVYRSNRSGKIDIWLRNIKTGEDRPLTSSPASESMPRISPDGSKAAYSVMQGQTRVMYTVSVTDGNPQVVCPDCGPPAGWSRDGATIYYTRIAEPHAHVYALDIATGKTSQVFLNKQIPLYGGRVSSDNQWFSFKGDLDVARTMVFAAQLSATPPAFEQWVKVTEGRFWDDLPRWSPDGNTMFFTSDRDGFRCIWARRLDPKMKQPKGEAFPVVHLHKMQLSLANLSLAEFELAAGKGRLVFPMGELRGNIWLMEPASQQ